MRLLFSVYQRSIVVPARKNSNKVTEYGAYPGATVIRSVEDWLLGDSDGIQ